MAAIDDFKHSLETYGLQAKLDHFLQAIQSSFLSEGRLAIDLSEPDGEMLYNRTPFTDPQSIRDAHGVNKNDR